jgi:hypothetical protein
MQNALQRKERSRHQRGTLISYLRIIYPNTEFQREKNFEIS